MITGIYFITIILSYCLSNIMYRKMNSHTVTTGIDVCIIQVIVHIKGHRATSGRITFCLTFLTSTGGMKLNGLKCEL